MMHPSSSESSRTSIDVVVQIVLLLWTIYAFTQQSRQGQYSAASFFQPFWLYRIAKQDKTAITDTVLYLGLTVWKYGLLDYYNVAFQLIPSWVMEERFMEIQIFAMIFILAVLAGIIASQGEESVESSGSTPMYVLITMSTISLISGLWLHDVRTFKDLTHFVFPPWIAEQRPMEVQIFSLTFALAVMAGLGVWRGEDTPHIKFVAKHDLTEIDYPIPPLIIPGRTTHTRLFPEKHSFGYSYLLVGVPVGWVGRAGSVLSSDVDHLPLSQKRKGWFDINAEDFLSRDENHCLEHKLAHYLQEQGVSDEDWSFAYLVTAPKFLGYSFNPVSFWYIYDDDDDDSRLTMMILEVNNTFDERRMYLLKSQGSTEGNGIPTVPLEDTPSHALKFSNGWKKDFHVSPFNDREGSYTLTATDPLASLKKGRGEVIDNLIQLKTPDGKTKIVARVFSKGTKDPYQMKSLELFIFLAQWFWVGFLTFPRIIRQAWTLYFKKRLDVWFRPEILPSSIGRRHTAEEATIEYFFHHYLQHLITHSTTPLRLSYVPPSGMGHPHLFASSSRTAVDEADTPDLTLHITSPIFYTRFVHYSHTREAVNREGLATDARNRTLIVSDPRVLHELLESGKRGGRDSDGDRDTDLFERVRWKVLTKLRCPPPLVSYPTSTSTTSSNFHISDIRALPPSNLDIFVRHHCPDSAVYRSAVTKLFLAQRYARGFTAVVRVADLLVRGGMIVSAVALGGGIGRVGIGLVNIWSSVKGV